MRVAAVVVFFLAMPGLALAQGNRSQTWEWSIAALYQQSKNMGGGMGSSLNVKDDYGLGFNLGYNFSNNLAVGFDLDYLSPDYTAILVDDTVSPADKTTINHELTQWNGRLKGIYSFGDGVLQPFVEAGLGWSSFDSNVADGPPIVGCWWHPYWGQICSGYYNTFNNTTFTYGAGLGLRYRFRGGSFLKASYNVWELDDMGGVGDSTISGARLEFGWGF